MKSIYSCAAAMLMILAGAAVFRPYMVKAGPGSATTVNSTAAPAAVPAQKMHWAENYGKLPLSFEANQGQTDSRVKFLSRGRGYALFLTGDEAVLTLESANQKALVVPTLRSAGVNVAPSFRAAPNNASRGDASNAGLKPGATTGTTSASVLRMRLVGANGNAAVAGADELPGKSNYFIGNDPKKWRTNVPNYAKVKYQNVYPGVDLVYYGNQGGQLEYDFVVTPGADPSVIVLDVGPGLVPPQDVAAGLPRHAEVGAVREPPTVAAVSDRRSAVGTTPLHKRAHRDAPLQIAANGDLVVKTHGGEVRFHKPVVYQPAINNGLRTSDSGLRTAVEAHYVLQAGNQVGFKVPSYDHTRPLFIDPVLSYSTYLGGSTYDEGYSIAVDSSGNAYVTGTTSSVDFPTASPFQATNHGIQNAFVTKLDAPGSALVYSTYMGGSDYDVGRGIAVDSSGNAYVTGYTDSSDFPTVDPLQATNKAYPQDTTFEAKLDASGSALVYSTYLGGSGFDAAFGIAVDTSGNAYVTGYTNSPDFPLVNPFQTNLGSFDAFVAKLNAAGSALVYSTYLGTASYGEGIAVDFSGNAYVVGITGVTDFPTVNPIQATNKVGGCCTAFVSMFNATGSALVYSTYLGGSGSDIGLGIAVDFSGNAYVTGGTGSRDFPTVNPIQATNNAGYPNDTAFVAKLNSGGSSLAYSTYLGGNWGDQGNGIAVDSSGDIYVTGITESGNFPTVNPIQVTNNSCAGNTCGTAFVAKFNAAGSALVYSTYLGGSGADRGNGIAVDSSGNAYVTGQTSSTNFPTVSPFQATNNTSSANAPSGGTAFVAKISPGTLPSVSLSPTSLTFSNENLGTTSGSQQVTLSNTGNAALTITSIVPSANFGETDNCNGSVAASASCTISVTFSPTVTGALSGTLTITDNNNGVVGSTQTVSLSGTGIAPIASVTPSSLTFSSQALGTQSGSQTFTLNNTGNSTLTITSIAFTGANPGDFGESNPCGVSVLAGGSCTFSVWFIPTAPGSRAAGLTITDNSNNVVGSQQSVSLTGTGSGPVVNPPTSLIFVGQNLGTTSTAQSVTLTNTGNAVLNITNVQTGGADPADFAITITNCGTVPVNGSCSINVTFAPTVTGSRTASLSIVDNAYGSPQTVILTGTGINAKATLSPISLSFGSEVIGTTSAAKNVTLTSTGTTNLIISDIAISGANAGDFSQTNTCTAASYAKGAKCTISVNYTPSILGVETASLAVADNAANSPQTVALSGTGVEPVTLSPTSLSFGNVVEGNISAGKTITLTNNQKVALTNISVSFTGSTDYAQANTCGTSIAASQKCTITVTLAPLIIGAADATLSISDSAANSPQTAALTGTGTTPVTLSPTSATYSSQKVGTTSAAKVFTLTSSLKPTLDNINISASGDFDVSSTTCGASLAGKGKCTIDVVFKPTATGTRTGKLSVSDSAGNSPQTSQLTGTGK